MATEVQYGAAGNIFKITVTVKDSQNVFGKGTSSKTDGSEVKGFRDEPSLMRLIDSAKNIME